MPRLNQGARNLVRVRPRAPNLNPSQSVRLVSASP
jgi:hypothetical protein